MEKKEKEKEIKLEFNYKRPEDFNISDFEKVDISDDLKKQLGINGE